MSNPHAVRQDVVDLTQVLVVEGTKVMRAFASRHGLHATDVEALAWLNVAQETGAAMTAGALAEHLGLTSGAVTAVVDRLERAGHVTRSRDGLDRRKVVVHYSPAGRALADDFFGPLLQDGETVMQRFTDAELQVVRRYLAATAANMTEQHRSLTRLPGREG